MFFFHKRRFLSSSVCQTSGRHKRGESWHFIFLLWHRLNINVNQPRTDWKFMTSSGDQIVIATPSEIYIFIFTFAFFWGFDYLEERPGVGKKRGDCMN